MCVIGLYLYGDKGLQQEICTYMHKYAVWYFFIFNELFPCAYLPFIAVIAVDGCHIANTNAE